MHTHDATALWKNPEQPLMSTDKDEMIDKLGLRSRKRFPWKWLVGGGALFAAAAVWLFVTSNGTSGEFIYVTSEVSRSNVRVTVSATGTVEPTELVDISSELSGTVKEVNVDFNDLVEVGTQLATLDTTKLEAQLAVQKASFASAEAKLAQSEATLKEARANYQRAFQLTERGVQSTQYLDAEQAAYERAEAELEAAKAARDLAQANLDVIQVDLNKSCICSPIKGVVLDRDVDEGQIVAASLSAPTLFTIADDLTRMELQVDIDEADIGKVKIGQSAIFTVEAYDDREFPAEISELRYASETVDGVVTYKGILTLDNSDMALRPGMTATADIVVASVEDALVVPNAALRYLPPQDDVEASNGGSGLLGMVMPKMPAGSGTSASQGKSVWVMRDGVADEVAVKIGETDGNVTVVQDGELAEGDKVITDRIDAE